MGYLPRVDVTRILRYVLCSALLSVGCGGTEHLSSTQTAFPEAEANGIDSQMLASAFLSAGKIDHLRSLLVSRNGVLVAEEYFGTQAPDSLHEVRSVTKSVTSILIGIAIDRGYLQSVDQPIAEHLGNVSEVSDDAGRSVTIRHLLTMSGGFQWAEFGDWSDYVSWRNADNQVAFALGRPVVHTPGERFTYNDAACHLLSVVLTLASGMSTHDFADRFLFEPLGIEGTHWLQDRQGFCLGSVGLYLSARDMIKLGALYLQDGTFDGRQVVPKAWVSASTDARVSTGIAVPYGSGYGYLWWVDRVGQRRVFYANGYGGQFIFVVPDLELVVAATCTWNVEGANENWSRILGTIVNGIVPAVRA